MFSALLVFFQLHQPTLFADVDVQRIVNLAVIQVSRRGISLAKRRHPQVDKGPLQACAAKTARPAGSLCLNFLKSLSVVVISLFAISVQALTAAAACWPIQCRAAVQLSRPAASGESR